MNVFDLIKITEWRSEMVSRSSKTPWFKLQQQIYDLCDCKFPDGSSTVVKIGTISIIHVCQFCRR